MQESADRVSELMENAASDLKKRSERMLYSFSFVPADKLNWSPSATSRSSARIVAHCALVCQLVAEALTRKPEESMPSAEEFFKNFRESEVQIATSGEAANSLKKAAAELGEAFGMVTAENIDSEVTVPFGVLPMRSVISFAQEQLAGHVGQLDYLQTIWGDVDTHAV